MHPHYEQDTTSHTNYSDSNSDGNTLHCPHIHATRPKLKFKDYKIAFLVDDSESMKQRDHVHWWKHARTRWGLVMNTLYRLVPAFGTGVDLYFLNETNPLVETKGLKSEDEVETIAENVFPSSGSNSLGSRMRAILEAYMEKYRIVGEDGTKPLVLVVITDGTHVDGNEVIAVIESVAQELNKKKARRNQVGIQMIQLGGNAKVTALLEALDDDLGGRLHGIVDATPCNVGAQRQFGNAWLENVVVEAIRLKVSGTPLDKCA